LIGREFEAENAEVGGYNGFELIGRRGRLSESEERDQERSESQETH
jgi:hypothetical protein